MIGEQRSRNILTGFIRIKMIRQAGRNINDALSSIKTVIFILAVICGGVWWQAYETSTTRQNIEQLFEMNDEIKQEIGQVKRIVRDHDGRIIRLEEFRGNF